MEEFSYSNIFETKGIEYIVVIIFFAILIPFWILLNRRAKLRKQFQRNLGVLSPSSLVVPQGILFGKNHSWTHLDVSGVAKVGLDDLMLRITGDVNFKVLKKLGDKVIKGEALFEVVKDERLLRILSPITGEVIDANSSLSKSSDLINEDPYQRGWVYKIKPSNWIAETSGYYLAEEAVKWTAQELNRFKEFLAISAERYSAQPALLTLQDGGELRDNPMAEMDKAIWLDFQREFLGLP